MGSHKTDNDRCPGCGYAVDRAGNVDGERGPEPGDLSVCMKCALPLVFGPTLRLKSLTTRMLLELTPEERSQLARVVAAVESTL